MTTSTISVKEGPLYRYNGGGLLSFKKVWRPCYAVLTDDSVLKLYKDQTLTSKNGELNFQSAVLWLAFGKDAEKYDPPKADVAKEHQVSTEKALQEKCYIAVPKDKNRESITWLATENVENLHDWIRAIALTVKSKYRPPILGAKRSDYKRIIQELREHFRIDENTEEWEAYWLYSALGNRPNLHITTDDDGDVRHRDSSPKKVEEKILEKIESNLIETEDDILIGKIFPTIMRLENADNLYSIDETPITEIKGNVISPETNRLMAESDEQRRSFTTQLEININKRHSNTYMD